MSAVFTLKEILEKQGLGPDTRAFCETVLRHGEVLAVALSYLPDTLLWLVTTPVQARLMRNAHREAVTLTLGEAADLAASVGDPRPTSLWQVAVVFSAPAPEAPEDPEDAADPWD